MEEATKKYIRFLGKVGNRQWYLSNILFFRFVRLNRLQFLKLKNRLGFSVTHVELLENFICSFELCLCCTAQFEQIFHKSARRTTVEHALTRPWSGGDFISSRIIFSIWPNYRLMPDIQLATRIVWLNPFLFWSSLQCIGTICVAVQCGDRNRTKLANTFHFRLNPFAIQQMCAITICASDRYIIYIGRYIVNNASNGFRMPSETQWMWLSSWPGSYPRLHMRLQTCIESRKLHSIRMQYVRKLRPWEMPKHARCMAMRFKIKLKMFFGKCMTTGVITAYTCN